MGELYAAPRTDEGQRSWPALGDTTFILPVRPGRSYRGGEAADVASPAIPQSAYSAEMP